MRVHGLDFTTTYYVVNSPVREIVRRDQRRQVYQTDATQAELDRQQVPEGAIHLCRTCHDGKTDTDQQTAYTTMHETRADECRRVFQQH